MGKEQTYIELQDALIPDNPLSSTLINNDWGVIDTIWIALPDSMPCDCIMKISYLGMVNVADTVNINEQQIKFEGSATPAKMVVRIDNNYLNPSAIQKDITQIAYTLGAGYLVRFHHKLDAYKTKDEFMTMRNMFGCKTYRFITGDAEIGDNNNEDLIALAYKHGHWCWEFNATLNGKGCNIYYNKWLQDDPSLNAHGGRKGKFPGWKKNYKFGIELKDHYDTFERSTEHGVCLSANWNFIKRIPVWP